MKAQERRARLRWPSGRRNRLHDLERLEDRVLPVTINWTGLASGDWAAAANWTDTSGVHRLPISTDDVFIGGGNTVTHSTGSDTIHSLLSNGALVLSGGALTDTTTLEATSTFTLSGGTLNQATVAADTTITGTGSGGSLGAVTLQGILDLRTNNGASVSVSGGLTLDGATVQLGHPDGSTYGRINFSGAAQALDGTTAHPGTILMGSNINNGLVVGGPLTLGSHLMISGTAGFIAASNAFDNQATITADPTILGTAAGTFTLSGANWVNHGTIQAGHGDSLTLSGQSSASAPGWTNAAGQTISISGAGSLTLGAGGPADADGTTWLNQGTLAVSTSTVNLGGTFTLAALGTLNHAGSVVNLTAR